jgi:L-threonylcarbamoyladenylate synthase
MTRIVKCDEKGVKEASGMIMGGELVAYPTDTVYALGCDPFNSFAVQRLLRAKERSQNNLSILVESFEKADSIGAFDDTARLLAEEFWPGPLTIVVDSKKDLPGSGGTVGLRIPARQDTIELITQTGGAIVGTSANISGSPAARSASDVMKQLDGRIALVLDGGQSESALESTVVRVGRGRVSIIREKAISAEKILAVASPTNIMHE